MTIIRSADNEQFIKLAKVALISTGVWIMPITENRSVAFAFKIYSLFMKGSCVMYFSLLFAETIRLIIFKYDMDVILASVGVLFNAAKIMLKVFIYLKYHILEHFEDVIEKERALWNSDNEELKALYRTKVRHCNVFVITVFTSSLMAVTALQLSGAFTAFELAEYSKANNITIEPHVMYQSLFPFSKLDNLYWWLASQALWWWVGLTYNTMTHAVFAILLIYAATQLEILQIRLRNCIEPEFSETPSQMLIKEKVLLLRKLTQDHKYVIDYVKHFNECTKYAILLEFLLTSLDTASVSVNIIKMKGAELSWLLSFLVLLVMQISLIAWTCNEIQVQSMAIADAIFASRWYCLLDKEAIAYVHFMIVRAQKPLLMTIGPFGPMTTASALMVFKAAYSYVSIMKE
ncbi:odorant receptor 47b [Dendroctonus ponderosae]|uniref:Odorant receptor n=3 Tax=Dendroctonus ponderosae TaxID=77166 RepID=J3JT84_DENPD|nr:odorant receptor 47b [Dendroctonus ponderosae]AEE61404.1 unknown [Dendroctonus ponderosae]ERL93972.1 hypothetical protein D910_11257 [Dendroctonus ponderosae]KAH1027632.1 hypothetical protein HUJ05_001108 [Dendroctonus ponderosae]